jgi:hypothetical protein
MKPRRSRGTKTVTAAGTIERQLVAASCGETAVGLSKLRVDRDDMWRPSFLSPVVVTPLVTR